MGAFFMAGHHDIERLHDTAREMLLDYREELTARWKAGERNSDLKRVKEQLNNLDLDPWSYGDILDDALSKGADAKQVMKDLRNHQSRTMKLWENVVGREQELLRTIQEQRGLLIAADR